MLALGLTTCMMQRGCDARLLFVGHLREERQNHPMTLGTLTLCQVGTTSAGFTSGLRTSPSRRIGIGWLQMRSHDAPARGDALIEHPLHHIALIGVFGEAYAVALPIRASPFRFRWLHQTGYIRQQLTVPCRHLPSP